MLGALGKTTNWGDMGGTLGKGKRANSPKPATTNTTKPGNHATPGVAGASTTAGSDDGDASSTSGNETWGKPSNSTPDAGGTSAPVKSNSTDREAPSDAAATWDARVDGRVVTQGPSGKDRVNANGVVSSRPAATSWPSMAATSRKGPPPEM
ncbi:MAG: hypothetical protein EVA77_01565 [Phycisphaeraceae bacterium]|nr:MAG: hypothetical protein EVA77_01565 [Phycisphaeraceae bacterium]